MLLDTNDVRLLAALLKWGAMEHDKHAKVMAAAGDHVRAMQAAKFSQECIRLLAEFEKAGGVPLPSFS